MVPPNPHLLPPQRLRNKRVGQRVSLAAHLNAPLHCWAGTGGWDHAWSGPIKAPQDKGSPGPGFPGHTPLCPSWWPSSPGTTRVTPATVLSHRPDHPLHGDSLLLFLPPLPPSPSSSSSPPTLPNPPLAPLVWEEQPLPRGPVSMGGVTLFPKRRLPKVSCSRALGVRKSSTAAQGPSPRRLADSQPDCDEGSPGTSQAAMPVLASCRGTNSPFPPTACSTWTSWAPGTAGCEWEGQCRPQRTTRDTRGCRGRGSGQQWGTVLHLGSGVQARPSPDPPGEAATPL